MIKRKSKAIIKTKSGKTVDSEHAQILTSREAVLLLRLGGTVYKVLAYNTTNIKLRLAWLRADADYGLPTPYISFEKGRYQNGQANAVDCYIIEMKDLSRGNNTFFQFSNGGVKNLKNMINTEQNIDRLKNLKRGLEAGKNCGLMDPQGYFIGSGASPIMFIDVHTRPLENYAFDELIIAVKSQML